MNIKEKNLEDGNETNLMNISHKEGDIPISNV
jgi:hypothetical protein